MSGELVAAAIGAIGVSEATGATNFTAIGTGGGDDGEDSNPISSIPGFAPRGPNGGPPAIDLSGLSLGGGSGSGSGVVEKVTEKIVQVPTGSGGSGGGSGGLSWEDVAGNFEEGSLYDPDRIGGSDGNDSGGSSGSGGETTTTGAALDAYNRITTPNDTVLGLNAGERTNNAVEDGGEAVGGLPMKFLAGTFGGAIDAGQSQGDKSRQWLQNVTGIEKQGTNINEDRPGIGISDIITSVSKGTQDGRDESDTVTPTELPGAVYEDAKSRAESGPQVIGADFGPSGSTRADFTSSSTNSGGSGSPSSGTTPDFSTPDIDRVLGSEDPEEEEASTPRGFV